MVARETLRLRDMMSSKGGLNNSRSDLEMIVAMAAANACGSVEDKSRA